MQDEDAASASPLHSNQLVAIVKTGGGALLGLPQGISGFPGLLNASFKG
jgi:hypothetical protein